MHNIIGLSGYARSGKDLAASALSELGYERLSFADPIREFLEALNPLVGDVRLNEVLNLYTWDHYKNSMYGDEIRRLLQKLGTECGREIFGENVWVDIAMSKIRPGGLCVITDLRFLNEYTAIKNMGGETWRISREGYGPINNHISETALDNVVFDRYIENTGTKEEFKQKVLDLAKMPVATQPLDTLAPVC